MPQFRVKYKSLKKKEERNKLDQNIRKSGGNYFFKRSIAKFLQTNPNCSFDSHNPKGIELITRLRIGLSLLCEHSFLEN